MNTNKLLLVEDDPALGMLLMDFLESTGYMVSWKRDGRTLASCGADNVIKVWDFVTGERKKTIEGFSKEVTSICYVSDSDQKLEPFQLAA